MNSKVNKPSKAKAQVEIEVLRKNQKKVKSLLDRFVLYPQLVI
jgi:hypothetical protein